MIDEKHLAATLKNRLPGWQCDVQQFILELIQDRKELQEALEFAQKKAARIEEKPKVEEKPVVVEPKADEQVKVETTATVEKKPAPKKGKKKSFFGRKSDI